MEVITSQGEYWCQRSGTPGKVVPATAQHIENEDLRVRGGVLYLGQGDEVFVGSAIHHEIEPERLTDILASIASFIVTAGNATVLRTG